MKILPVKSLFGEIKLPGDKSISHRAAIFAALAVGKSSISNFSTSEDCRSTLNCLAKLGIKFRIDGSTVSITGRGKRGLVRSNTVLDCGNSGTTIRLLSGVLAGQEFDSELTGDASLNQRPMERVIVPLNEMGAKIESLAGKPPLRIVGKYPLSALTYELPIASAQLKSAILLAGLNSRGKTLVRNPASKDAVITSRNHSELMLKYLGAVIKEMFIETDAGFVHQVSIDGGSGLSAKDIVVPADVSASAFFVVAASILEGSDITLKGVGLNPTRTAFLKVLQGNGAQIETFRVREVNNEAIGDLRVRDSEALREGDKTIRLSGSGIANLIDEIPILAVLGTQIKGGLEVRDAKELRVKESDRISAVAKNLKKMGADITEYPDGFRVGKSRLKGAVVESFGDHRIAMAFAIAGLFAEGETEISDADCVNVSFPGFFEVLASIVK